MKFFHLSDLHIGLRLQNYDMSEDQSYILKQIVALAAEHHPDAVVIAGDIYDKAIPSAEAVSLFDAFVASLHEAVPKAVIMMISGNHDSAPRINCFRHVLQDQSIHMVGLPPVREEEQIERVTLNDSFGEVCFYLLPFVKPSMVKQVVGTHKDGSNFSYEETLKRLLMRETIDPDKRNVFVSHQFYLPEGKDAALVERMASEVCTVGNIDAISARLLAPFDYAALGHIHKPMTVGDQAYRYCGTPFACSVSEAGQQKSILCVEMKEKGDTIITPLALTPLRQVRVVTGTLAEVLALRCEDYVSVVLKDTVEHDIWDLKDRLKEAFPYLLEIRRENARKASYDTVAFSEEELDPYTLCCRFLSEPSEEECALLQDVIRTVQGVK